jgi:membrane associated rhomboid family serine protease
MLIPYRDDNPTSRFAVITFVIIVMNTLVYLHQINGAETFRSVILEYGLIPHELASGVNLPNSALVPPQFNLFSYMFVHAGFAHLIFNMLFLWIFGNNIEDIMTRPRFIMYYLTMGMISGAVFAYSYKGLVIPLVGASGAISGILGTYLVMFPRARIHVLLFIFRIKMPALVFLPIWFTMQVSGFLNSGASGGGVAWVTHISGFVAGLALFKLFMPSREGLTE